MIVTPLFIVFKLITRPGIPLNIFFIFQATLSHTAMRTMINYKKTPPKLTVRFVFHVGNQPLPS